jgi:hypothetical protein
MARLLLIFGIAGCYAFYAFESSAPPPVTSSPVFAATASDYFCPMDRDIHSASPGACPRCGMKLVAGLPEYRDYPVQIWSIPSVLRAGEQSQLFFRIHNPQTARPVQDFEVVHEKLYHLFVVSQDLGFFLHTHPEIQPGGQFSLELQFPHPGMYRTLSDFYPRSGTPQLQVNTLVVQGNGATPRQAALVPDVTPKEGDNLMVELATNPGHPVAGTRTSLFLRVSPNDGIEPYLGAMSHLLAASSDLSDMIHGHPYQTVDVSSGRAKQIEFQIVFPRAGVYRVWVQFQRRGVVNTVAFNIPVSPAIKRL